MILVYSKESHEAWFLQKVIKGAGCGGRQGERPLVRALRALVGPGKELGTSQAPKLIYSPPPHTHVFPLFQKGFILGLLYMDLLSGI